MSTHNDRPTLRQLEYLVAVADEGSFSRAAARCFVSQPTLSGQVRLLETRIGQDCFERTSRGVFVTPAGEEIVAQARKTLASVDQLLVVANTSTEPLVGRIRLGSVSTITPYLLPEVIKDLATDYPQLQIELHDDLGERLHDRLLAGELDAIVTPLPTGLEGCEEFECGFDPFVLVAPAGTPLGDLPEPISIDALQDQELILLADPHCIRGQALNVCEQARCSADQSLHATSISALVQLVRQGLGATLLPTLALQLELRWLNELRIKRFREPAPGRSLGLAWRSASPRRDDFVRLGGILMKHVLAKTGEIDLASLRTTANADDIA